MHSAYVKKKKKDDISHFETFRWCRFQVVSHPVFESRFSCRAQLRVGLAFAFSLRRRTVAVSEVQWVVLDFC